MAPPDVGSTAAILWRRVDRPGYESARLAHEGAIPVLLGRAAFADERGPCGFAYRIECDREWRTRDVEVSGWIGADPVAFRAAASASGEWTIDGLPAPELAGCVDVDLNFSPSTNLLPIRRLRLGIGDRAEVTAAWVRFPTFRVEPLFQTYRRLSSATYRYTSAGGGGRFEAELTVNEAGFVTAYPGFFESA